MATAKLQNPKRCAPLQAFSSSRNQRVKPLTPPLPTQKFIIPLTELNKTSLPKHLFLVGMGVVCIGLYQLGTPGLRACVDSFATKNEGFFPPLILSATILSGILLGVLVSFLHHTSRFFKVTRTVFRPTLMSLALDAGSLIGYFVGSKIAAEVFGPQMLGFSSVGLLAGLFSFYRAEKSQRKVKTSLA